MYRNGSRRVGIVARQLEAIVARIVCSGQRVALHVLEMLDLQHVLERRHLLGARMLLQTQLQTHEAQAQLEASACIPSLLLRRLRLFCCCQHLRAVKVRNLKLIAMHE